MFKRYKADSRALCRKSKIKGVGINDAWYKTSYLDESNVRQRCPYYVRWTSMFTRCYGENHLLRNPTYEGCSVDQDWHLFSNFLKWMEEQDWVGKQLDKDILVEGNKVYGGDTCIFVDSNINQLFSTRSRGNDLPCGVAHHKAGSKYQAYCNLKGKRVHLGLFTCLDTAELAHLGKKLEAIKGILSELGDGFQDKLLLAIRRKVRIYECRAESLTLKLRNGEI